MTAPDPWNTSFDKNFYDFIYGSIHHHDYAGSRADYLISRFGKVKFLDIGCGCGILVKELRARGAKAWGIDVSDYALSVSCAPKWCLKGDVRAIPFEDGFFDVVHSLAMHGYYPEADIDIAIAECKRVGDKQAHNIDIYCPVPAYGYNFMRPSEYWERVFPGGMV